jgi:hypothetical protein
VLLTLGHRDPAGTQLRSPGLRDRDYLVTRSPADAARQRLREGAAGDADARDPPTEALSSPIARSTSRA